MFHICKNNLEFIGLGYDMYQPSLDNYGLVAFKLYKCKKCGKPIYKNKTHIHDTFFDVHNAKMIDLINTGYKPIGDLLKK